MVDLQALTFRPYRRGRVEPALQALRLVIQSGRLAQAGGNLSAELADQIDAPDANEHARDYVGVLTDYQVLLDGRVAGASAFEVIHASEEETPAALRQHLLKSRPITGESHDQVLAVFLVCLFAVQQETLGNPATRAAFLDWAASSLPRIPPAHQVLLWDCGGVDSVFLQLVKIDGGGIVAEPSGQQFVLQWKTSYRPGDPVASAAARVEAATAEAQTAAQEAATRNQAASVTPPAPASVTPPAPAAATPPAPATTPPAPAAATPSAPATTPAEPTPAASDPGHSDTKDGVKIAPRGKPRRMSASDFQSAKNESPSAGSAPVPAPAPAPPAPAPAAPTPPPTPPPTPAPLSRDSGRQPSSRDSGRQPSSRDSGRQQAPTSHESGRQRAAGSKDEGKSESGRRLQSSGRMNKPPIPGSDEERRAGGGTAGIDDVKAKLKDRLRRQARGETVEDETPPTDTPIAPGGAPAPAAGAKDKPAAAPLSGWAGLLLNPSYLTGMLVACGCLALAGLAHLLGAGGASEEGTRLVGEGAYGIFLYLALALFVLRADTERDGGVLWFSLLLIVCAIWHGCWLGWWPIGLEGSIESLEGRRLYYGLVYSLTVLWCLIGVALAQRLVRYPAGGLALGLALTAPLGQLLAASAGSAEIFGMFSLYHGAAVFPLVALECLARPESKTAIGRRAGLLSRLLSGRVGEPEEEEAPVAKGRPIPGMGSASPSGA